MKTHWLARGLLAFLLTPQLALAVDKGCENTNEGKSATIDYSLMDRIRKKTERLKQLEDQKKVDEFMREITEQGANRYFMGLSGPPFPLLADAGVYYSRYSTLYKFYSSMLAQLEKSGATEGLAQLLRASFDSNIKIKAMLYAISRYRKSSRRLGFSDERTQEGIDYFVSQSGKALLQPVNWRNLQALYDEVKDPEAKGSILLITGAQAHLQLAREIFWRRVVDNELYEPESILDFAPALMFKVQEQQTGTNDLPRWSQALAETFLARFLKSRRALSELEMAEQLQALEVIKPVLIYSQDLGLFEMVQRIGKESVSPPVRRAAARLLLDWQLVAAQSRARNP